MSVESRRESRKRWKLANPEKVKAEAKLFRERHKEELKEYKTKYYPYYKATHSEEMKEVAKNTRRALILLILKHYGKGEVKCVWCGESRLACLSIDHIRGGGNKHRKQVGSSMSFYRWLRDNGYPKGYQTLCMNCQRVKSVLNNEVPHRPGDKVLIQRGKQLMPYLVPDLDAGGQSIPDYY